MVNVQIHIFIYATKMIKKMELLWLCSIIFRYRKLKHRTFSALEIRSLLSSFSSTKHIVVIHLCVIIMSRHRQCHKIITIFWNGIHSDHVGYFCIMSHIWMWYGNDTKIHYIQFLNIFQLVVSTFDSFIYFVERTFPCHHHHIIYPLLRNGKDI